MAFSAEEQLLELLETTRRTWSAEVTTACLERFDRRLVEEIGGPASRWPKATGR